MARGHTAFLLLTSIAIVMLLNQHAMLSSEVYHEYVFARDASGMTLVQFYYGWLNLSGIQSIDADIVVVSGTTMALEYPPSGYRDVIDSLISKGVEVYAYLHDSSDKPLGLGSSYNITVVYNATGTIDERAAYWESLVKASIDRYAGVFTGVFFDECDPSYFGTTDPTNIYLKKFTSALWDLVNYAHQRGLKVIVNGVRAYAHLGDYYLWECFMDSYTGGSYTLDQGFLSTTDNGNPFDWESGYGKYLWLKNNGTLSRTIALTLIDNDLSNKEIAEYGYYMARILGIPAWGFAPGNIYADGSPIAKLEVYDPGPPIAPLFVSGATATRLFASGNTTIDLSVPEIKTPFTYTIINASADGEPLEYPSVLHPNTHGTYTTLAALGVLPLASGLYIYANILYSQTSDTGCYLRVYIDRDNSSTTGYQTYGIGADYMVEIQVSGYNHIYSYTGDGGAWSWSDIGPITAVVDTSTPDNITIELSIPYSYWHNGSRIVVAPTYGWSDDSSYITGITNVHANPPTIYDDISSYTSFYGIIESISIGLDSAVIIANGSSGMTVNYTIILPFSHILSVMKNGSILPKEATPSFTGEGWYARSLGNGYSLVVILARHRSPINITITAGTLAPVPEQQPAQLIPYITLAAVTTTAAIAVYTLARTRKS